jgi:hypothetical protein
MALATRLVALGIEWLTFTTIMRGMAALSRQLDILDSAIQHLSRIALYLLLIIILFMFVRWVFRKEEGTVLLPFEKTSAEVKYDGKAILDSLIAELHRIRQIHLVKREAIESDEIRIQVAPPDKEVQANLPDVRTSGRVGETVALIISLLVTIKKLLPVGKPAMVITGSIQCYGKIVRLVARLEQREVRAVEVSRTVDSEDQMPSLIQDLAYKIAFNIGKDQSLSIGAETWLGFKYFTEALDGYDRYMQTGEKDDLERVRASCLDARKAE